MFLSIIGHNQKVLLFLAVCGYVAKVTQGGNVKKKKS